MPPKGRPKRTPRSGARKSVRSPENSPLPTDAAGKLEAETEKTLAKAPQNDVVVGSPSEPLASTQEPVNAENSAVSTEVVKTVSEAPQDDAVLGSPSETVASTEDGSKEVVVAADNSNGGKAKRVVKKKVIVVKKVIKKVPKKVVKSENDSKVSDLDKAGGDVDSIPKPNFDKAEDFKVEVPDSEERKSEVDETKDVSVAQDEREIEVDERKGGSEAQDERVEVKESELMEVDNKNEGDSEVKSDKDVAQEIPAERDEECGKENEDLGISMGEVEGKEEEEEEGAGEREEEAGEGKLLSGELEAMERKKRRKREVFIGGLDKDATEDDIRKVFAGAGEIVDLRLVMNAKTGKNKGFAFVRYASAEDAKRALEMFSKVEICGKECGATPVEGNDTIFLGNIDKKWKDENVIKLLYKIGIEKIDKVNVLIDPNNSECNRGFAFVEFETNKDAQIAYKKLQKKDVFGKNQNIKVAWAEPLKELDEQEMLKVKTVYAEFIPSSWDEEKVRDTFKKFGDIGDVVLARNLRASKRKDFAFISYETREAAVKCIESFSHELRNEEGRKVNVKVSLAKPAPKSKKPKPAAKPVVKEVPQAKPKASHSNVRANEPRNTAGPSIPHYDIQIPQRSSPNVELVRLLREQASWRPPHGSLTNSSAMHYSNPLSGRKRQFSVLETDPLPPDMRRYPHFRFDASYPVASSSQNMIPPSGLANSLAYHQRHSISGYPSGSLHGARNYPSDIEIRDKTLGSSFPYRRY